MLNSKRADYKIITISETKQKYKNLNIWQKVKEETIVGPYMYNVQARRDLAHAHTNIMGKVPQQLCFNLNNWYNIQVQSKQIMKETLIVLTTL